MLFRSKINNLIGKRFKVKYRYVYDDLEKSVTSAQAELCLPRDYANQAVETNPTKNSSILIVFNSGPKNVTKIELLAAQSNGVDWTDFFLIKVIDKTAQGIFDNATIQYNFLNDQAYNQIDIKESIQPFDLVPQKSYTQTLPNGNVLTYASITEGYNKVDGIYQTDILNNNRKAGQSN